MKAKEPRTILNQTLSTLREGFRTRRWAGVLPGVAPLAKELGVSTGTLQTAFKRLEAEGLLIAQGRSLPRVVAPSAAGPIPLRTLRVGIVTYEPMSAEGALNVALIHGIMHDLEGAGHLPFFMRKTMQDFRHDPESIRKAMTECAADAWVLLNAGRPLLESLAASFPVPVMAVGGTVEGLDIASTGVDFKKATREAVHRLVASGHRRIVMAVAPWLRRPKPQPFVNAFNEELAAVGIKAGPYHLPDWEPTGEGFNALLRSLFMVTPPTALLVDDMRQVCAVYAFLAERRIPPRDLALVLIGFDPTLEWMSPRPVHFRYENEAMIRRVTGWAATLAEGGRDTAQVFVDAQLVGDAFNPPPKS